MIALLLMISGCKKFESEDKPKDLTIATFHSVSLNKSILLSIKSNNISTEVIVPEELDREELINKIGNTLDSDSVLCIIKNTNTASNSTMINCLLLNTI